MRTLLKLLGGALLLGACGGGGILVWAGRRRAWHTVHGFAALLDWLLAAIRYQAWPCEQLLESAARDARFAVFVPAGCRDFAALPVPPALAEPLHSEAVQTLAALGGVPRRRACALLARLLTQCRAQEASLRRQAENAARLYPKLGFCAGVAAVLFWL